MRIMKIMCKLWHYPFSLYPNSDRGFNVAVVLQKCRKKSTFPGPPKKKRKDRTTQNYSPTAPIYKGLNVGINEKCHLNQYLGSEEVCSEHKVGRVHTDVSEYLISLGSWDQMHKLPRALAMRWAHPGVRQYSGVNSLPSSHLQLFVKPYRDI